LEDREKCWRFWSYCDPDGNNNDPYQLLWSISIKISIIIIIKIYLLNSKTFFKKSIKHEANLRKECFVVTYFILQTSHNH
jgi:hypothetical protein